MNGKQATGNGAVGSGSQQETGPDVCRCQCESGGACSRKMCSGAAALARDVKKVADETTGANWGMSMERVRALCIQTLAGEAVEVAVGSGSRQGEAETPLKRAAGLAMDFVALLGKLSDADSVKAIEVMKSGLAVELLARMNGKVVAHA